MDAPQNTIRAYYDEQTIRVYQAYGPAIADAALAAGTFVSPPFKRQRMTWIKPSFLWMMYRSGWAKKDENQTRVLAIDITREGFDWALAHSCDSHPPEGMPSDDWQKLKVSSPVRIQWDPERDLSLQPLPVRSIQIGLSGSAVDLYTTRWIKKLVDVTDVAHAIHELVEGGRFEEARARLPIERAYPQKTASEPTLSVD